jgi:hypothetical protein
MKRIILRKIINFIALAILFAGIYYLALGKVSSALGFLVFSLGILTPRYLYENSTSIKGVFNSGVLSAVEILLTTVISLCAIGYLWLFHDPAFFNYDTYVHFIAIFLLTIIFAIFVAIYFRVKKKKVNKGQFVLTCIIFAVAAMFVWEAFEYIVGELILKVQFYGQVGQPNDTLYDLLAGALSIPLSSVLIYKYLDSYMKRWHKFKDFVEDFN